MPSAASNTVAISNSVTARRYIRRWPLLEFLIIITRIVIYCHVFPSHLQNTTSNILKNAIRGINSRLLCFRYLSSLNFDIDVRLAYKPRVLYMPFILWIHKTHLKSSLVVRLIDIELRNLHHKSRTK